MDPIGRVILLNLPPLFVSIDGIVLITLALVHRYAPLVEPLNASSTRLISLGERDGEVSMAQRTKRAHNIGKAQAVEKIGALINDLATEVLSFKGVTVREWLELWQPELPRWLNTSQGEMRLNHRAVALIEEVASIVGASNVEARALVEPDVRFNAVANALGETLLWAHKHQRRQTTVDLDAVAEDFLGRLSASFKDNRIDVTWLVPCHIFDDDQEVPRFSVGPVTFCPRADWLAQTDKDIHKDWIADHWSGAVSQEALLKRTTGVDAKEVTRAWSSYHCAVRLARSPWVAEVHVPGHAASRSRRKADALVDLALSFVSLACGPENAAAIIAEGRNRRAANERSLGFDPKGHCFSGSSVHKLGVGGEKGSAVAFVAKAQPIFADGGEMLRRYLADSSTDSVPPLIERWIGALYWFGLAVHEPLDFMAVVHYGCAIDILSDAGGNLSEMAAFVEAAFGRDAGAGLLKDGTSSKDVLNRLYNEGRSGLVHGSRHGLLEDMTADRHLAHELVRNLLIVVTTKLSQVVREEHAMLGLQQAHATRAFIARLRQSKPATAVLGAIGEAEDGLPESPVQAERSDVAASDGGAVTAAPQ